MLADFIAGTLGGRPEPLVLVHTSGKLSFELRDEPCGIMPGSFNPLHDGHRAVRAAAERFLGGRVYYEISVTNVDKPPMDADDAIRRMEAIVTEGQHVIFTHAPLFVEKARLAPGRTFVVGFDTASRICSGKYSNAVDDLRWIGSHNCDFLVAPRLQAGPGTPVRGLADLDIPDGFAAMFRELPADMYTDAGLSSSAIRAGNI